MITGGIKLNITYQSIIYSYACKDQSKNFLTFIK